MQYNISLSEEAEEDISVAYSWYEQQKNDLGYEFTIAVEAAFSSICSGPEAYSFRKKNVRGCIVKGFPYLILFSIERYSIIVLSVFHMHRKPIE